MLYSTPVDYHYSPDKKAERVLRAIQDRERQFITTYTLDIYRELSGVPEPEKVPSNRLKHEWIDRRLKFLKKMGFIEQIEDEKDRRKAEVRSQPEKIYTYMIEKRPKLFWELIDHGYLYFIFAYRESHETVVCPRCSKSQPFELSVSGNKASRYKVRDELHIDAILKHVVMRFSCSCGYSYSDEADMFDPATVESFSKLFDAANNHRNLL